MLTPAGRPPSLAVKVALVPSGTLEPLAESTSMDTFTRSPIWPLRLVADTALILKISGPLKVSPPAPPQATTKRVASAGIVSFSLCMVGEGNRQDEGERLRQLHLWCTRIQ